MNLPPLQLSQSSSSKAGDLSSSYGFDASGFNVNYAPGSSLGGSLPSLSPVTLSLLVLGVVLWKKYS